MAQPHTIIRMGAAHYDVRSSFMGEHATLDLAQHVMGLPKPQRIERLGAVALQLAQLHDIGQRKRTPARHRPKAARRFLAPPTAAATEPSSLQLASM